jgi:hypothetical protein
MSVPGETPRDLRPAERVGAPVIHLELDHVLELLRASDSYRTADHAATTILKRPGIRVLLVALKIGGQMHDHHTDAPITVQVLEGAFDSTSRVRNPKVASGALCRRGPERAPRRSRRGGECLPTHDRAILTSP